MNLSMNLFRCQICGTPHLDEARPNRCPFCGVSGDHLTPASEYQATPTGELSRKCRENLERALDLVVSNSTFYRGVAQVADNEEGRALFSVLARIETEHASILCILLGVPSPEELFAPGECSPSHKENLAESYKRETRVVQLYTRFLEELGEERVRQVLAAFIEAGSAYLSLFE